MNMVLNLCTTAVHSWNSLNIFFVIYNLSSLMKTYIGMEQINIPSCLSTLDYMHNTKHGMWN